jgi:hypothetical protein
MPKLKKLAVFDINEARVTKYIPLTDRDITFAAGLDAIVIGLKTAGKLERWSLTTFELEKTGYPPFKEDIKMVHLGHASNGPLVVNGVFLDLNTFGQLPILDQHRHERVWEPEDRLLVSGDGTVYARWGMNSVTFTLDGSVVRRNEEGGMGHVYPGPDGKTVFTGKGLVTRNLKRADPDDAAYGPSVPAVRGDYFISFSPTRPGTKGSGFSIYLRGLKQPIAKLDKGDHGMHLDGPSGDSASSWRTLFLVPDAKVIAYLPVSNDQVVLHKFDPDAALEKSGQDYLIVTSSAPREVKLGATFSYPIKVKSKQGAVTFTLDSGPKGMAVSAAGVVTWAVPADAEGGDRDVILTVRDKSGQEVFHTFAVRVAR